jgi:YHS domain-containing protein
MTLVLLPEERYACFRGSPGLICKRQVRALPAIWLKSTREKKMRKIKLMVLLGVTLGLLTVGWSMPMLVQAASQTKCPVMGGKVNEKVYADYQGKRVYFCCAGCINEFKKDPEKYLKKIEAEGATPAKTP